MCVLVLYFSTEFCSYSLGFPVSLALTLPLCGFLIFVFWLLWIRLYQKMDCAHVCLRFDDHGERRKKNHTHIHDRYNANTTRWHCHSHSRNETEERDEDKYKITYFIASFFNLCSSCQFTLNTEPNSNLYIMQIVSDGGAVDRCALYRSSINLLVAYFPFVLTNCQRAQSNSLFSQTKSFFFFLFALFFANFRQSWLFSIVRHLVLWFRFSLYRNVLQFLPFFIWLHLNIFGLIDASIYS